MNLKELKKFWEQWSEKRTTLRKHQFLLNVINNKLIDPEIRKYAIIKTQYVLEQGRVRL